MSKSEIEHVSLRQIPLRTAVAHATNGVLSESKHRLLRLQTRSSPTVSLLVPQFYRYVSEASSPPSELIEFRRDHTCSIQARLLGRFGHLASRLCSAEPPSRPICVGAATSKPKRALKSSSRADTFQSVSPVKTRACLRESPP